MTEVGIQRLRPSDTKKYAAHHEQGDDAAARKKIAQAHCRIQGPQDRRMLHDPPQPEQRDCHEPDQHDRPQQPTDAPSALLLHREQRDKDHHGRRQHVALQVRRYEVQPLQCRHYRDCRRNRGIAVQQRRAAQTDEHDEGPPLVHPAQKRHQGENATFAAIVERQGDSDVFQRDDDHQRPQDQRQRAEHCRRFRMRAARHVKHGLERVERTSADVAKHHAKGG